MSSGKSIVVSLSVLGLAGLGAFAWYAQQGGLSSSVQPVSAQADAARPVVVEVVEVVLEPMADELTAVGSLRSNESVILRPEIPGRISAIRFENGMPAAKGAVLVEFDAAIQQAELQQARAGLALAESNSRRTEDLFQRNFVSQSARDEAANRLEVARAALQLAQARVDRMKIVAPFAGTLGIRSVSVGDYVKDGEDLVNLEDISVLKVDFRLPEIHLPRIRVGQVLEVTSDALPGVNFPATVDAIDPLVDVQGRAVVMQARLSNEDGRLRPGMFARVRLILDSRPAVAVLPEEALVPAAGNTLFVYRVDAGRVKRVEVRTGVRRNTRVEIVDGLSPGDVVVTAGQLKLRDGETVLLVPTGTAVGEQAPGTAMPPPGLRAG